MRQHSIMTFPEAFNVSVPERKRAEVAEKDFRVLLEKYKWSIEDKTNKWHKEIN